MIRFELQRIHNRVLEVIRSIVDFGEADEA